MSCARARVLYWRSALQMPEWFCHHLIPLEQMCAIFIQLCFHDNTWSLEYVSCHWSHTVEIYLQSWSGEGKMSHGARYGPPRFILDLTCIARCCFHPYVCFLTNDKTMKFLVLTRLSSIPTLKAWLLCFFFFLPSFQAINRQRFGEREEESGTRRQVCFFLWRCALPLWGKS